MSFEPNQGQAPEDVKFLSRGQGYTLYVTPTEAVMQFPIADLRLPIDKPGRGAGFQHGDPFHLSVPLDFCQFAKVPDRLNRKSEIANRQLKTLRMKLLGANPKAQVEGVDKLPGITNYFIGNDPKQWRTNIPNYSRVVANDAFPGVSMAYHGSGGQLEFDFILAPGVHPYVIKLAYEGTDHLCIDPQGDIVLNLGGAEIRQKRPRTYQEINGARHEVTGRYVLRERNQVGFQLDTYDVAKALVIDPDISRRIEWRCGAGRRGG
jgi:hypothetical protein